MAEDDDPGLDAAYALETPEDNKRLYRRWASTYESDFASKTGYRFAALIAEAYLEAGGGWPALDAGCGTGLVADGWPEDAVADGLDISAEMLAEAEDKGRYRALIEADLTRPLPLPDGAYAGLASAGTFTHGHVGPEALPELMRVLRPGAVCVISGRPDFFAEAGFGAAFEAMAAAGAITAPEIREERIYAGEAPEGHDDDLGWVIVFRRL